MNRMELNERDLTKTLEELQTRLKNIEEKFISSPREEKDAPTTIHLHVQKVNIEKLQLEELAYHLGSIDIKELSGMLNLGNTFSPSTSPKKKMDRTSSAPDNSKQKENHSTSKQDQDEDIEIIINGKKIIPKI